MPLGQVSKHCPSYSFKSLKQFRHPVIVPAKQELQVGLQAICVIKILYQNKLCLRYNNDQDKNLDNFHLIKLLKDLYS